MTTIDERIHTALDEDDKAFLASLDSSRGLFTQLGDSLGGPLGGWAKLVFAMTFVMAGLMFYCAWQMFASPDTRETILWATGTVVLVMSTGFLKDWLFSRMNMFTVLREVKRLQLQVAMLEEERG